jgi:hypothetical protein
VIADDHRDTHRKTQQALLRSRLCASVDFQLSTLEPLAEILKNVSTVSLLTPCIGDHIGAQVLLTVEFRRSHGP